MSALSIQPTYPIFTDIDGQPLESGYIWIGAANLDPQTNPINVYWDAALTIPSPQPIRTLAGYPSRNGTPARLYVNSDYSIRVMNKNGSTVYSAPAATDRFSDTVVSGVNSSEVTFLQAGTGAVTRTAQAKMRDLVSAKDFGAIGDGTADDTTALTNWLNNGGGYLPRGVYKISSSLTLPGNCVIQGENRALSIIRTTSATADVVVGPDNCANYYLQDFTVDRSVVPVGSPSGISIGKNAFGYLINVVSINHHTGFKFGPTSRSRCDECEAAYNYGDGFHFYSTSDSPFVQWYLIRPVAQLNNGHGFYFNSASIGSLTYVTGPTIINSGTYANTSGGYFWTGAANTYWTDMVFTSCFSSSDGNFGFHISNLGSNNQFSNVFSELAGQSFTGRTFTTPKSNTGPGFLLSGAWPTESSLKISGIFFKNSYQGIAIENGVNAKTIQLDAIECIDNGFNASNTWDGVFIGVNASSRITISNLVSKNVTVLTNQRWGFNTDTATAANIFWVGGDCKENDTGAVFPASGSFGAFLGVGT